MSKKYKRSLPVFIGIICVIAAILCLVTPFMYDANSKSSILGFCLIFGGKYTFNGQTLNISFNWAIFFAWLFLLLSAIYSIFVCPHINKANSIITFIVLVTTAVLFTLTQRFCLEVLSGNVGHAYTIFMSCGSYIVLGFTCLAAICSLVDVCKKRN